MSRISQLFLAAATLLVGCAPRVEGSSPANVVGVSSGPSLETARPDPPPSNPAPAPNPALTDGAPAETVAAYEHLLIDGDLALGDECGPELGATSAWRALSVLVEDDRPAMLWDLTTRATTSEARASALIGLAKLRSISEADARDLLRHQRGAIVICKGSERTKAPPHAAAQFLPRRLEAESSELAMP